MTWIHIPSTSLVSVPVGEASTSDSDWRFPLLASSVQWRSKPMPVRFWSRVCKTVPWMMRLSGQICDPSEANRGVEQWILLLRASRASHSVRPASDEASTTTGIFGLTLPALSVRFSPPSSSLRMFQTSLLTDSRTSTMSYKRWVSMLHQDCSRRLKSARRMNENGSLFWPTPTAAHSTNTNQSPTPNAAVRPSLALMVRAWPTPNASQAVQGQNEPDGKRGQTLIGAARGQMWGTPEATSGENGGPNNRDSSGRLKLSGQAAQWMSPRHLESGNYQFDPKMGVNKATLTGQATTWGTPRVTTNGGIGYASKDAKSRLEDQAADFGHQDQTTPTDGAPSSRNGPVLNPRFVEMLQGWPVNWSSVQIGSGCSAMVLYQWQRRWRSWLFGINSSIDERCVATLGGL